MQSPDFLSKQSAIKSSIYEISNKIFCTHFNYLDSYNLHDAMDLRADDTS